MDKLIRYLRTSIINSFVITVLVLVGGTQIEAQQVTVTPAPQSPTAKSQLPVTTPPQLNAVTDSDGSGRERTPPLTERERILLERIEQLERRLIEVESRVGLTASADKSADKKAAEAIPSTTQPSLTPATPSTPSPQPEAARAPGTVTSESEPASPSTPPARQHNQEAWDKAGVKIIPYGFLVASAAYNTWGLIPGSIGFFAIPRVPRITGRYFSVSIGNTLVGADIIGPKIGDWAINGKFDFNLRGPTPVTDDNVFAPYFANVYVEAKTERHRILAGQAVDVVSPISPRSLNLYPGSYLPGDIGTARPQLRYEYKRDVGDQTTFVLQGALATAVQTLQVSEEVLGFGTDVPDGQLRLAIGHGQTNPRDPKRPFELGISGHIGQRRAVLVSALFERDFTTWSGGIDVSAKLGSKAKVSGELFVGSILGDYKAGILHTFNPFRGIGIRAAGGWAQLQYQITSRLSVAGGYSLDDTFNRDLSPGFRSRNDAVQGNVFYSISPRLHVGLEVSRWHTRWVGLPDGKVVRIEPALWYIF